MDLQFLKIKHEIAKQKVLTPHRPEHFYRLLYSFISLRAIKLVREIHDRFLPKGVEDKLPIDPLYTCNSQ